MSAQGRLQRVSDAIVERIQRDISNGTLASGQRLPPERDMAKLLKTSRIPVREAYRLLEEQGLLRIRRGAEGGTFVRGINDDTVRRSLSLVFDLNRTSHRELTEARLLIEPLIARLAAQRADPDDIARLERELLEEERGAFGRDQEFRPTHSRFHRLVADCARNFPLRVMMDTIADLTAGAASAIDREARRRNRRRNCHYHRLLLEAIERHDGDAASAIMTEHVRDVQRRVQRTIAESPES
jgi:GntR family transcriptional regulator, transcriptional repressor for pyruvate dehydrogenase complex